ncbi:26503_t:CDS:2, partial [Racocetra persica]
LRFIDNTESGACSACPEELQTIEHFLFNCTVSQRSLRLPILKCEPRQYSYTLTRFMRYGGDTPKQNGQKKTSWAH